MRSQFSKVETSVERILTFACIKLKMVVNISYPVYELFKNSIIFYLFVLGMSAGAVKSHHVKDPYPAPAFQKTGCQGNRCHN
jgi:hypothetical protein